MNIAQNPGAGQAPWMLHTLVGVAVLISIGLAALGAVELVGVGNAFAIAGTLGLIAIAVTSELMAAILPIHVQRAAADGAWIKSSAAVLVVVGLTAVNLVAGHIGLQAINAGALGTHRAPIEARLDAANADLKAATAELEAAKADQTASAATWAAALAAMPTTFVTAGNGRLKAADDAAKVKAAAVAAANAHVAAAQIAVDAAKRDLANAPHGRPDRDLWAIAIVLELMKGLAVWIGSARQERVRRARLPKLPDLAGADLIVRLIEDGTVARSDVASALAKVRWNAKKVA